MGLGPQALAQKGQESWISRAFEGVFWPSMASTEINRAIYSEDLELLKLLLRLKGPNEQDLMGDTGLHACGRCGSEAAVEMAAMLLRAGANVNILNRFEETALDSSVFWEMRYKLDGRQKAASCCREVTCFLLQKGASRRQCGRNNDHWSKICKEADVYLDHAGWGGRAESSGSESDRGQELEVPVESIEFSRDVDERHFDDGRSLKGLVEDLISGRCKTTEAFLRLRCVLQDDRLYCRDNRRLWCLKAFQDHIDREVMVRVKLVRRRRRKVARR